MNTFQKARFSSSIVAAAIAAAGLSAAFVSQAATPVGGPTAGMVCRTGYTPAFNGTALTCSKAATFELALVCLNPTFPNYVIRIGRAGSEEDICVRNDVVITSSQSLENVPISTNGSSGSYMFATFDPVALANLITTKDGAEAAALGLSPTEVDTRAGTVVVRPNGRAGGKGEAQVPMTFMSFAVPNSIVIGIPGGPVGLPSTANSTTPFVPKALPR